MKGDINLNLVHQISLRNEMRILRLTKELYNIDILKIKELWQQKNFLTPQRK